jgi:hypothetical protein
MPVTTVDTPLRVKEAKFAAHVAAGEGRVKAAAAAGYVPQKKRTALERRVRDIAQRPNVAAEIRRLTWLSCPPAGDARGMREHSVRILSDLSRSAASEEVRLKAALALYRIAETTLAAAAPDVAPSDQDKLLASLRRLYTEVQGMAARAEPVTAVAIHDPEAAATWVAQEAEAELAAEACDEPEPDV